MPPKPKFTREEIIAAALELVSERGMDALTARELGARLGSSARPVFTVFRSMEEVQQEVKQAAMRRFETFAIQEQTEQPVFKGFGVRMIRFAVEEPKLFQLLFMTENESARNFEDIMEELGNFAQISLDVIERDYQLSRREARLLFQQIWIYTFGIGALCAAKACCFTEEEISLMLSQAFTATMMLVISGRVGGRPENLAPKEK